MSALDGKKIGFVGAGAMATAIMQGLLKRGVDASRLMASDPYAGCRERAAASGIATTESNAAVAAACDVIVVAVKPGVVGDALRALASDGAGALPEEPIRPASEEFELVQRASGAGLVSTKAMSMGVTIAALLFLLGVCVGCVCSLRLVAVVLTCGLCGRERQRKRGEKKD